MSRSTSSRPSARSTINDQPSTNFAAPAAEPAESSLPPTPVGAVQGISQVGGDQQAEAPGNFAGGSPGGGTVPGQRQPHRIELETLDIEMEVGPAMSPGGRAVRDFLRAVGQRPVAVYRGMMGGAFLPPSSALAVLETGPLVLMEPGIGQQFSQCRRLLAAAKTSMAASAAFMILAGVELIRLHKLHGVRRGGDRKSADQTARACGLKWDKVVEQELGIGESTARKYMAMAEAARERMLDLNSERLLNTPISEMPEMEREELIARVQKCTDGQTAQQLMWEWGIAKPPTLKGGNQHPKCPHCSGNLPAKDAAVCPKCKAVLNAPPPVDDSEAAAIDIWRPLFAGLRLELEHRSAVNLPLLGEFGREQLAGLLTDHAALLREVGRGKEGL